MAINSNFESAWNRLLNVSALKFKSISRTVNAGWNGEGQGVVDIENVDSTTILFHENGKWRQETGKELKFNNVYRWTKLPESLSLRLEHLRFGPTQPVYLFDLQQTEQWIWQSTEPYVCRDDLYSAIMKIEEKGITLQWTITGATKDESIDYFYK